MTIRRNHVALQSIWEGEMRYNTKRSEWTLSSDFGKPCAHMHMAINGNN